MISEELPQSVVQKIQRYLSNIKSNFMFYFQAETYVFRPFRPRSLVMSSYYLCGTSPLDQPLPFIFPILYPHPLLQSPGSKTLRPDLLVDSNSAIVLFLCIRTTGTAASSHLKHFRETRISCCRAQRDMPVPRLFEVASQGEPEPGI